MGTASGKGSKKPRTHKASSGNSKRSRARRKIMRDTMKINRWNRYKEEIVESKRQGSVSRWDVSGLEKHIKMLEKFV